MHWLRTVVGVLCILSSAHAADPAPAALLGFSPTSAADEQRWEERFRAIPDPSLMRQYMQRLSARPHHLGSAYDKENAEWILAKFHGWGLDAHIESFDVLFPTPRVRVLEMVEPQKFTAKLEEPALTVDPTSNQKSEQLPTFNAYSIDGEVTAPLVYVNYGVPEDYEQLERLGVSVKGAIVIAKYGDAWRGVPPRVAWEHGAIGCLTYSDPKEDGYFEEDVFPQGPMRPKDGVQRGSVMDFPNSYPGDPLTPGIGATSDAKRLPITEARNLTKIPVLPISYGDAQPLLAALKGAVAPVSWRGALPITYHVGPGPTRVHLKVEFNWKLTPLYNVIARIPGTTEADELVVRGNHHDAWVNGAEDPTSAQIALLEEARALAELYRQGWRPKRTILLAAWDGEEPMLLGSTEWGEAHAEELSAHAVAYINSDSNGRGYLFAYGSHNLEAMFNGVARDIPDPETNLSVWKRLQLKRIADAGKAEERKELRSRPDLRITALGSGTDYTVFVDHLGIPSLYFGFGREDQGLGVYHSIYDDFYWFTHFSDSDFIYARSLAQTAGTTVMRLADADLLPFQFTNFSDTIQKYIAEVKTLLSDTRDQVRERNQEIDDGVFLATNDPRRPRVVPKHENLPPHINFAPLDNAAEALSQVAERYKSALAKVEWTMSPEKLAEINHQLIKAERRLTNADGLPGRPWFKHLIYAPGRYTGYAAKTLPGVREGIELKKYAEAEAEVGRVAKVIQDEATLIRAVVAQFCPKSQPARPGMSGCAID